MLRQSARVCCLSVRLVSTITPRTLIESEMGIIEPAMVGSVTASLFVDDIVLFYSGHIVA